MTAKLTAPARVLVVAANHETVGELQDYLSTAGVIVGATSVLPIARALPPRLSAVVMFPDDYDEKAVTENLGALRTARPRLLVLLVTSAPQRLGPAAGPSGAATIPLILPKPAFGWSILDAIRAHTTEVK